MSTRCTLLVALAASACTTTVPTADYTLRLQPSHPKDQSPFDGAPALSLEVAPLGAEAFVVDVGTAKGELSVPELPPLPAGSRLALSMPNAYGEVVVPEELTTGEQQLTLPMLVGRTDAIGNLGSLPVNQAAFGTALALLPDGRALIFGGARSDSADGRDKVFQLDALDAANWSFGPAGTMPPIYPSSPAVPGRAYASATVVQDQGLTRVLVAGGRSKSGFPDLNSRSAFLYDPDTATVVWEAPEGLTESRSEHEALLLSSGNVLLVGGFTGEEADTVTLPVDGSLEIFDVGTRKFRNRQTLRGVGIFGVGVASLGPQGALVCGGAQFNASADSFSPTSGCFQVELDGDLVPVAALPAPLMNFTLTGLPGGGALAVGGLGDEVGATAQGTARAAAYRFTPGGGGGTWAEVGALQTARAQHGAVALPDGSVLVVGGVGRVGPFDDRGPSQPALCPERFDPATNTFAPLALCTSTGAGSKPKLALSPTQGLFVISGWWTDTATTGTQGGQDYGYLPTPE